MQSDGGVEEIAAERTQPRQRPLLIGSGKLAVSGDIGRQNCGQLPIFWHVSALETGQGNTIIS
jgi:hypothetical protein